MALHTDDIERSAETSTVGAATPAEASASDGFAPFRPSARADRRSSAAQPAPDACALLDADHLAVETLFRTFSRLAGSRTKPAVKQRLQLAGDICLQLTVHARLEDEVFYPAMQGAVSAAEVLAEAAVEHDAAAHLVGLIAQKLQADTDFDAMVKTLAAYVSQHVHKERSEIFTLARQSHRLDLQALGRQLAAERVRILQEETQRVAEWQALVARERLSQRAAAVQQYRDRAKAKRSRRGQPVGHTLALRDPR